MSPALLALSLEDDFLSTALLLSLAVFVLMYALAFFHELGHALLARWNGFVVTSFGVGAGRFFWVGSWRGTRIP